MKTKYLIEEKGIALILAMLLLLVVTLIGISAVTTATFDNFIAGNKRASEQAFYVAEAGINEFMGRFRSGATSEITDSAESNATETTPPWRILLAKSSGMGATKIGYGSGDANTTSIASLQTQLDFGVEVKHKVDGASPPNIIKYANKPIYIAKGYGYTANGGNKIIEIEIKKAFIYDPPAALYSERPVHVNGSSTYINGNDACGTAHKPGIITTTTLAPPIDKSGDPGVYGSPSTVTHTSIPPPTDIPIQEMIEYLKNDADFKYSYSSDQTLSGYSDSWGTPSSTSTTSPITYTGPMKVVYFNMEGKQLHLAGGSHGAGILLVEGDLDISGGFTWYGVVMATGAVTYTGGGEKNITGGVLAGESATVSVDIGGNAGIVYCSSVADSLKNRVPPFKVIRWKDIF